MDSIGVVAFGILAHGLLGGTWTRQRAKEEPPAHFRHVSLFQKENIERNIDLVENLLEIAREKNCTLSQLVLAWALTKGSDVVPLLGASRLAQFEESFKARDVQLSQDDVRRIEAAVPKDKIAGNSFRKMEFKSGRIERVS